MTLRASAWSNGRKPARNISIFRYYQAPFGATADNYARN